MEQHIHFYGNICGRSFCTYLFNNVNYIISEYRFIFSRIVGNVHAMPDSTDRGFQRCTELAGVCWRKG